MLTQLRVPTQLQLSEVPPFLPVTSSLVTARNRSGRFKTSASIRRNLNASGLTHSKGSADPPMLGRRGSRLRLLIAKADRAKG
jgi:hypothetical protein